MMQTLTKTEIAWIYSALENEVDRLNSMMNIARSENHPFAGHYAECRRDGLRGVMHKLHTALNEGSKRIGIK